MRKNKKNPYTQAVPLHVSGRRKMLLRVLIIAAVTLFTILLWFMALISPKGHGHKGRIESKSVPGSNRSRLKAM